MNEAQLYESTMATEEKPLRDRILEDYPILLFQMDISEYLMTSNEDDAKALREMLKDALFWRNHMTLKGESHNQIALVRRALGHQRRLAELGSFILENFVKQTEEPS